MWARLKNTVLLNYMKIVTGLFLITAAYRMFLIPNNIAPGGFTGISQLVNYATNGWVNVGFLTFCMNVPLFVVMLIQFGWRAVLRSMIASFSYSLLVDVLPFSPFTDDAFLATVYGGVLGGAGFGLILSGGASTGGSDTLGKLLNRRFPFVRINVLVFLIDAAVVIASAFVFDARSAMYALVSVFIMNFVMGLVLEGPTSARAYFIISEKNDQIADAVMRDLERGATGLHATGMYSNEEKTVLLCVVSRNQSLQLRLMALRLDPKAFIIATNVHEALGEGFQSYAVTKKEEL